MDQEYISSKRQTTLLSMQTVDSRENHYVNEIFIES